MEHPLGAINFRREKHFSRILGSLYVGLAKRDERISANIRAIREESKKYFGTVRTYSPLNIRQKFSSILSLDRRNPRHRNFSINNFRYRRYSRNYRTTAR